MGHRGEGGVGGVTWFWMSFATEDDFLGALIIEAPTLALAVTASHMRGLNPGGEVASLEIPDEAVPPAEWRNRLLSRDDIEAIDGEAA